MGKQAKKARAQPEEEEAADVPGEPEPTAEEAAEDDELIDEDEDGEEEDAEEDEEEEVEDADVEQDADVGEATQGAANVQGTAGGVAEDDVHIDGDAIAQPVGSRTAELGEPDSDHLEKDVEAAVGQVAPALEEQIVPHSIPEAPSVDVVKAATPRLMIRQIVLENFKSYGNRKLIGPFHKSFSSIVGPNGSGKSNTIDALLFVFGKRAKKMRLKKVSELIHSSHALPNCESAKVEVTFQDIVDTGEGPEDYEVVEGSLLTVSRVAFQNNQSKYYVDGKGSNFTEVTQLLRKRGVDLEHNRFLILQGEVEQISLMKPKAQSAHEEGLLEYLEDIIGSNRLVEQIEEVDKQLETLTEQRQEKLNRLRVSENERENLDGPRKEAEAWVAGEGSRLELQALMAQFEARKHHGKRCTLAEEHKKLQSHMQEHRKQMAVFEQQVRKIEHEHNQHYEDFKKIQAQREKKTQEFKELERMDVKFTEDMQFQEQKIQKLQAGSEQEAEKAVQLVADAEKLRENAPIRQQELESAERHRASVAHNLEKIYASLKGKAEELRPQKEAKEAALVPLRRKLTEIEKVVSVAEAERDLIKRKADEVAEQIEELKRQSAECASRLKTRETEVAEANKLKTERQELTKNARVRLQEVASKVESATKEANASRVKAEEAKSMFDEEHTRGRLIRAVYEQSKKGELKGVHGRLGDLGTIPAKYDVAVSTACGMLDAIVVDTTADAQAVVEFVRKNDLGRTTCVVLEKIREREREMQEPIQTPEGVPRLIDLITPTKPEYKICFFYALNQTLVAKDLDQATRVGIQGRKRWRVVTLQGGLVDNSGTMSGGGTQVQKGGMRASLCLYSPEEVKELVQACEKAHTRLNTIRQEKMALETALQDTEKEIAEFDLRESKCSMEITSLKKQTEAYETRLKSLKVPSLNSGEKSKVKELDKLIASRSDELNSMRQKHQAVEEEVRVLHDQIMNIGGDELKQAKKKLEQSDKECEDLRKQIKKAILDADNMVQKAAIAEKQAKAALEEKVNAENALAKLKAEHAKLDDQAEKVLKDHAELKKAEEQKDKVLVELQNQRAEVINQASICKNAEVDLVNELEEKTRILQDLELRVQRAAAKLEEARKEYAQLPLDILKELREERAQEGQQLEAMDEAARHAIAKELAPEDLDHFKDLGDDLAARMVNLEEAVKDLKPNLTSIEEYRKADGEYRSRLADYEGVNNQREETRKQLEILRQKRLDEFMDGFSIISMKLKEMYQMITLGGDAELELVDTLDPFSEGINFSVRPPKKSWKQITNLSGGEKTLASLSLVFALHHYRPTPLYFMDEIDAALDFRNVSIIANYIKERTKNAQFIVISLRNHMFELADLLVGIYKTSDISKSVAIAPTNFDIARPPLQDANAAEDRGQSHPLDGPPSAMKRRAASALEGPAKKRAPEPIKPLES